MFNPNKIHFTSDILFRDKKTAIERGFENFEKMEDFIVDEWNSKVAFDDNIYHLGNFSKTVSGNIQSYRNLIQSLNGKKHFIIGDSDDIKLFEHLKEDSSLNIATVSHYLELDIFKIKLVMMAYPMREWKGSKNPISRSFNLHGGYSIYDDSRSFNVSYNVNSRIINGIDLNRLMRRNID